MGGIRETAKNSPTLSIIQIWDSRHQIKFEFLNKLRLSTELNILDYGLFSKKDAHEAGLP